MKSFRTLIVLLLLGGLSLSLNAQQDLRQSIVVVKPIYHTPAHVYARSARSELRQQGHSLSANVLDMLVERASRSGVILRLDDRLYVVTSNVLLDQVKSVTIERIVSPDRQDTLRNCQVVWNDPQRMVALIELPKSTLEVDVLTFASEEVKEGEGVFSIGFPYVGAKPTFQLSQGVVSNTEITALELNPRNRQQSFIQHTTAIDQGGFGGALLLKKGDNYLLLGINVGKIQPRQNAAYAISTKDIQQSIKAYLDSRQDSSSVARKLQILTDGINNNDYKMVAPLLSINYISRVRGENYQMLYKNAPLFVQEEVSELFKVGEPFGAIRLLLSYAIVNRFDNQTANPIEPFDERTQNLAVSSMQDEVASLTVEWQRYGNNWAINNIPDFDFGNPTGRYFEENYRISMLLIEGSMSFPKKAYENAFASLTAKFVSRTFVQYGVKIGIGAATDIDEDRYEYYQMDLEFHLPYLVKTTFYRLEAFGGFQLPLRNDKNKYITPYLDAFVSADSFGHATLSSGFYVGVDWVLFAPSRDFGLVLSAYFRQSFHLTGYFGGSNSLGIGASVGVCF